VADKPDVDLERALADWGECIICGVCSAIGHDWWCPRNSNKPDCLKNGRHDRHIPREASK
jgi:hypothetical protein